MNRNDVSDGAERVNPHASTAVSLYDAEGGAEDFPVLKAFQKYVDAEQSKARKRMVGLSAFFVALLFVVVFAFFVILMVFVNRNQALSDRLLDVALRDRGREAPPVVNVQSPAPQPLPAPAPAAKDDETLKPLLARIEALTAAIDRKNAEPAVKRPRSGETPLPQEEAQENQSPKSEVQSPKSEDRFPEQKRRLDAELQRGREELQKLRATLAAEREQRRQEEIERHRRRLYPDYYAQEDARRNAWGSGVSPLQGEGRAPSRPWGNGVSPLQEEAQENQSPKSKVQSPLQREDGRQQTEDKREGRETRSDETPLPQRPKSKDQSPPPKVQSPRSSEKIESLDAVKPIDYFADDEEDDDLAELMRLSKNAKAKTDAVKKEEKAADQRPKTKDQEAPQPAVQSPKPGVKKEKPAVTNAAPVVKRGRKGGGTIPQANATGGDEAPKPEVKKAKPAVTNAAPGVKRKGNGGATIPQANATGGDEAPKPESQAASIDVDVNDGDSIPLLLPDPEKK